MIPTFRNQLLAHASSPATQTPSLHVPPIYFAPKKFKERVSTSPPISFFPSSYKKQICLTTFYVYKGIPDSVRGVAWNLLILGHTHHLFQPPLEPHLSLTQMPPSQIVQLNFHNNKDHYSQRYSDLLMTDTEHVRQIDLDVNRTSRNHALYLPLLFLSLN